MAKLTETQYRILLVFRCALRRYLQWSSEESSKIGLTAQQHQLLLAVRAHPGSLPPSISELSEYLLIRHHSTVELANRVEAAGLVERQPDANDQRVIRVRLTADGARMIEQLSDAHLAELQRVAEQLHISEDLLEQLSQEFSEFLEADMNGIGEVG